MMEPKTTIVFSEKIQESEGMNAIINPIGTLELHSFPSQYTLSVFAMISDLTLGKEHKVHIKLLDTEEKEIFKTEPLSIPKENNFLNLNMNFNFENILFNEPGYYTFEVYVDDKLIGDNDIRLQLRN